MIRKFVDYWMEPVTPNPVHFFMIFPVAILLSVLFTLFAKFFS